MTMALSPAKTRSIVMTWRSAVTSFEIKYSMVDNSGF
jgi:hypothetical protein